MLALVAPGPRVTKQMPGRPLSLPCASAMKAAPPSWRQAMKRMLLAVLVEAVEHRQDSFRRARRRRCPRPGRSALRPVRGRRVVRSWWSFSAGRRDYPQAHRNGLAGRPGSMPARIVSVREWQAGTHHCQPWGSSRDPAVRAPMTAACRPRVKNDTFRSSDIRVHRNRRASLRPPRLACRARLGPAKRWLSCGRGDHVEDPVR